jgi:hypothetical protein
VAGVISITLYDRDMEMPGYIIFCLLAGGISLTIAYVVSIVVAVFYAIYILYWILWIPFNINRIKIKKVISEKDQEVSKYKRTISAY